MLFGFRKLRRTQRLLVIQFDGYQLSAWIVRANGQQFKTEAQAASRDPDPATALREVVDQLKGTRLPRAAVLLIPEAVQTVVSVPLENAQGDDLQELIQLELEARLSEQIGSRPLEEVLVERGWLSRDQVRQARHELEQPASPATGTEATLPPPRKLADVLLAQKMLDRPALRECEAICDRFRFEQLDASQIDWSAVPLPATPNRPQQAWLATGVRSSIRDRWLAHFQTARLPLLAIYPIAGGASAVFESSDRIPSASVLELHAGLISVARLARGELMEFNTRQLSGMPLAASSVGDLLRDTDLVWVTGAGLAERQVCEELETTLGLEIRLAAEDDHTLAELPSHVAGVVRHFHDQAPRVTMHAVSTAQHQQSRRTWVPIAATALAAAFLLAMFDASLARRQQTTQRAFDAAQTQLRIDKSTTRKMQDAKVEIEQLQARIDELDAAMTLMTRKQAFLRDEIPRRRRLPAALLSAVAAAASSQTVVDQIQDRDWQSLRIKGWALSQVAAERFADSISGALRPWRLGLIDAPVIEQGEGRLGLAGFRFELHFGAASQVDDEQESSETTDVRRSSPIAELTSKPLHDST